MFGTPWLPDLLCKHWFASSVWNFCSWVADVPPRETSQRRWGRRNGCFRRLPSESWRNFNRWRPRSQNVGFPIFDVTRLGILAKVDNLWSSLCVFLILSCATFTEYGKILFLKNLARLLSFFWKVLIGKMIVRISRCFTLPSEVHSYNTRFVSNLNFHRPRIRNSYELPLLLLLLLVLKTGKIVSKLKKNSPIIISTSNANCTFQIPNE